MNGDCAAIPNERFDQNTAYVECPELIDGIDILNGCLFLIPEDNCVLVAMDSMSETDEATGLHLGLEAQSSQRSDCGTVVCSGPDPLSPGDRVLVLPFTGKMMKRARYGEFGHKGRLLWVGIDSEDETVMVQIPWYETIVMKIQDGFKPLHDWVLVRRQPLKKSVAGILLPDVAIFRDQSLIVVAAGPEAPKHMVPESVWVYRANALVVDLPRLERFIIEAAPADYCLIRAGNLYAEIFQ